MIALCKPYYKIKTKMAQSFGDNLNTSFFEYCSWFLLLLLFLLLVLLCLGVNFDWNLLFSWFFHGGRIQLGKLRIEYLTLLSLYYYVLNFLFIELSSLEIWVCFTKKSNRFYCAVINVETNKNMYLFMWKWNQQLSILFLQHISTLLPHQV